MLKQLQLGFVGSGKMAEAMITGLINRDLVRPSQIIASGPRLERGLELQEKYKIRAVTDNISAGQLADIVTLAIKPQAMATVMQQLKGRVKPKALVVSIAAGICLKTIVQGLGHELVVRSMPNTPGRINMGITVWTAAGEVCQKQRQQASILLGALGEEVYVSVCW